MKVTITSSFTATIYQNLQTQEFLNTTCKYKITVPKNWDAYIPNWNQINPKYSDCSIPTIVDNSGVMSVI